jgi:hypothetical protein
MYAADNPHLSDMDPDAEAVYEVMESGYRELMRNE